MEALIIIEDHPDISEPDFEVAPSAPASAVPSALGSPASASASSRCFSQERGHRHTKQARGGTLVKGRLSLHAPQLDADGNPDVRMRGPGHRGDWNGRHHLVGYENNLLPKKLRSYFSRPNSLPDLKADLERKGAQGKAVLRGLGREEPPPPKGMPITADPGGAVCPERHAHGGLMRDRDGEVRPWNDRWSSGIHQINDHLHPLHRAGFARKSIFERAPSQRWRRQQDQEVEHGVWRSESMDRPPRFPPLGV